MNDNNLFGKDNGRKPDPAPNLPHSGSDASKRHQQKETSRAKAGGRGEVLLAYLREKGEAGATQAEMTAWVDEKFKTFDIGFRDQIRSVLATLREQMFVSKLFEERDGAVIFAATEFANGRKIDARPSAAACLARLEELVMHMVTHDRDAVADPWRDACDKIGAPLRHLTPEGRKKAAE